MAFTELRADEYAALPARKLGRLVAECRVSPVQLAELALALAKAAEPRINAYVSFLEPWARETAGEREREARAGRLRKIVGPFGSDALVLAFARKIESVLAFREHHPLPLEAR